MIIISDERHIFQFCGGLYQKLYLDTLFVKIINKYKLVAYN